MCGSIDSVELGVHLPFFEFRDEGQSLGRLQAAVDAAAQSGFVAVSANDHFVFSTPWLEGPTALAAVIDRSGEMTLATTIALAALRGPVPLAKALVALDVLSGGRVIAGVGPGSSERDYDALRIPSMTGGSGSMSRCGFCGRCFVKRARPMTRDTSPRMILR